MKQKISLILLILTLVLCAGCVRTLDSNQYKDSIPTTELASNVSYQLSAATLITKADEDYIRYSMQLNESVMKECTIFIQNAGASLDEFGIIKAADGNTAALEETIKNYLTRRNDEWTGMYLVEEYPKLRDAEYKVFGNYLVYGILSDADKTVLFNSVEKSLTES